MSRRVYGVNPVLEVLKAHPDQVEKIYLAEGARPHALGEVLSRAEEAGIRVQRLSRDRVAMLTDGGVHQGIAAEVAEFAYSDLEAILARAAKAGEAPLLLLLDGVQDPQNLGALIRSAHAFGAHGVVVPQDRAAGVTGVVTKASAGAVEHCPVARVVNLTRAIEQLKEANIWVAAATLDGDRTPRDLDLKGPSALVLGGEGAGVRPGVAKACDFQVRIPMVGQLGSLNVSAAGAVMLYEAHRQRLPGQRLA